MSMFAMIQSAPTQDTLGTALVMSRIMKAVAVAISGKIDAAMNGGGADGMATTPILAVVFRAAVIFIVIMVVLEIFRVFFKIIASGGTFWAHIAEPETVKTFMRASVCITLGIGAWAIVSPASRPVTYVPGMINSGNLGSVTTAGANGVRPMLDFLSPDKHIDEIGAALDEVAKNVNAYSIVSDAQEMSMKTRAAAAAEVVWKEMAAQKGLTPDDPAYNGDPAAKAVDTEANKSSLMTKIVQSLRDAARLVANVGVGFAMRIVYLLMYSALDLMIVRVLWANVIFMLIGYKIAYGLIPTLIVLAFFDSQRGMLVQAVKLLFVYSISLTIIAEASTALFVSTNTVKEIVQQVEQKAAASEGVDEDMKLFAKGIFNQLYASDTNVDHDTFMEAVDQQTGVISKQPFSGRSLIIAPAAVFMSLMLCITMLGKMATVVNDAISGGMSYIR
jgi:hypothetical protein